MSWTDSEKEALFKKLDTLILLLGTQGREDKRVHALKDQGLSFEEIAGITGIPAGTLKTRFSARP